MVDDNLSKRERQKARKEADKQALEEKKKKESRTNLIVIIAIAAVAVVLVTGAFMILNKKTDISLGYNPVRVEGTKLPLPGIAEENVSLEDYYLKDSAVGKIAPTITGTGFDNKEHVIGAGSGKPQAISVVAHWCPHCRNDVAAMNELIDEGMLNDDVELIALATSNSPERPNWPPTEWFETEEWPGLSVYDAPEENNGTLFFPGADALGVQSFPLWIFTDAEGKVVARGSGEISAESLKQFSDLAAGE